MSSLSGRGVARIFQRGGHTVPNRGYSPDFHVSLPPVVGCLPKTWLTRGGGGVTGTPGPPQATPLSGK